MSWRKCRDCAFSAFVQETLRMKKNLSLLPLALLLAACQPAEQTAQAPGASAAPQLAAVSFNGTDIRRETLGGDFTLTGGDGKPFSMASLRGKVVLLSFGYTHCPDICPGTLLTQMDVVKQLGEKAKDVAVVFVSVDPERDTPDLVGRYARQFNPDFIGLTAAGGQDIQAVKKLYRVISAKTQQQSDTVYLVDHSAGMYLLDKNGKPAVFEPYGQNAAQIASDVKILLQ